MDKSASRLQAPDLCAGGRVVRTRAPHHEAAPGSFGVVWRRRRAAFAHRSKAERLRHQDACRSWHTHHDAPRTNPRSRQCGKFSTVLTRLSPYRDKIRASLKIISLFFRCRWRALVRRSQRCVRDACAPFLRRFVSHHRARFVMLCAPPERWFMTGHCGLCRALGRADRNGRTASIVCTAADQASGMAPPVPRWKRRAKNAAA